MNKSVARIKNCSQFFLEGNLYISHLSEIGSDKHRQLLILYLNGSLAAAAILLDHWCPTFSSTGPHLLNGISLWAATNNSNYNGVQYCQDFSLNT